MALSLLTSFGCNGVREPAEERPKEAAVSVTTDKPGRKTLTRRIEQPGEIRAYEQTPVHAKIGGFVAKVFKDIGDRVKEGELLAELADPELDEELQQKKALVAQSQAEVEQAQQLFVAADADVKSAAAKVKEAEASRARAAAEFRRAESQFTRFKTSSSVLTQETLDEARLGVESSRAALGEVEAKIDSAEAARISTVARRAKAQADIKLADARKKVAEAEERRIAALVEYKKLPAPFAGVVTARNVDKGHFVQPSAGGKGEPAFVVAHTDKVRVFVDVPEAEAALIAAGTPAAVSVQALKGASFPGKVERTSWSLDARQRTLRAEIDLKNETGKLRPGMYAYAVIVVERPNLLAVPVGAVATQGEQSFLCLVEDGKIRRTPVRLGFRDAQFVEVLQKKAPGPQGLWDDFQGTENVVTGNPQSLADGQIVAPSGAP